MKVTLQNNTQTRCSFGNAGTAVTGALRYCEISPAIGAVAVDLVSMTCPRTIVDMKNRGLVLGTETALREGSSTVNFALVGAYGTLAGMVLSGALNNEYGIKGHKIFASNDFIDTLGGTFAKYTTSDDSVTKTLQDVLSKIETVGGHKNTIGAEVIEKIADTYKSASDKKSLQNAKELARTLILNDTGSETNFKLAGSKGKETIVSLNAFLDNTFSILETFKSKKVAEAFATTAGQDKFLKSLKNMSLGRSLFGLGIAGAAGLSVQPLITYFTKKRTGSDGFACAKGRRRDKSEGFAILKGAAAAAGFAGASASIGKPAELLNNLQFKSGVPTISQFKFIYGLTIASRLMSARDKDELRETAVRDTIGFLSWLVIGNFVQKGVVKLADKVCKFKYPLVKEGWGGKSVFVTRDEVVHTALQRLDKKTIETLQSVKFADMLKDLKTFAKSGEQEAVTALKKLRIINAAQLAGYAYSCVVLGILLPKLNIYMTKKSGERPQAASASAASCAYKTMLKPQNMAFLSNNM